MALCSSKTWKELQECAQMIITESCLNWVNHFSKNTETIRNPNKETHVFPLVNEQNMVETMSIPHENHKEEQ